VKEEAEEGKSAQPQKLDSKRRKRERARGKRKLEGLGVFSPAAEGGQKRYREFGGSGCQA